MSGTIEAKLKELDITIPEVGAPAGAYTGFVKSCSLVFVSGQVSKKEDGSLLTGKLGADLDVSEGQKAAGSCALQLIAQLKAACDGDLSRLVRVVKLNGFVNATPDFQHHPQVINGASELMMVIFGEAGVHARAAVGTNSLPFNVAVEIEAVFEIR